MQYWLMKSEPDVWSIDQQKKAGAKGAPWDGVRNYQAAKNLKGMKKGDLCFFYHSNIGHFRSGSWSPPQHKLPSPGITNKVQPRLLVKSESSRNRRYMYVQNYGRLVYQCPKEAMQEHFFLFAAVGSLCSIRL